MRAISCPTELCPAFTARRMLNEFYFSVFVSLQNVAGYPHEGRKGGFKFIHMLCMLRNPQMPFMRWLFTICKIRLTCIEWIVMSSN